MYTYNIFNIYDVAEFFDLWFKHKCVFFDVLCTMTIVLIVKNGFDASCVNLINLYSECDTRDIVIV